MIARRRNPNWAKIAYLVHLRSLATVAREISLGHAPTTPELAALIGTNSRTAARYIRTIRDFGAPLEFDSSINGYRFTRRWSFDKALIRWLRKTR